MWNTLLIRTVGQLHPEARAAYQRHWLQLQPCDSRWEQVSLWSDRIQSSHDAVIQPVESLHFALRGGTRVRMLRGEVFGDLVRAATVATQHI